VLGPCTTDTVQAVPGHLQGGEGSGLPAAVPHLHQAACHPGGEVLLEVDDDPVARQDVDTCDLPEDLKK
jgi:hypothetical protein